MRLLLVLTVLAIVLAGCGTSPAAVPRPHHRTMAQLNWAIAGASDVPTLDPALASDPTSITVASLVFGGLVRLDKHLHVQPDGASAWRISRDGKTYTFTIRRGLRYASGRPVTAHDFAGAIRRALGAEATTGTGSFYLGLIATSGRSGRGIARTTPAVFAPNRDTLRITLLHPAAHFLTELAFPASFVPDPNIISQFGPNWTEHASGFGPYSVRLWRHSRFLDLVPNPYYFGGKPRFRHIIMRFYPQGGAEAAFHQRVVDLVSGLAPGATLSGSSVGRHRVPGLALDYLAFNAERLPFHRINARRAFAAAWTVRLARAVVGSEGFPATTLLPSGFGISAPPWHASASANAYLSAAHFPRGRGFPPVVLVVPHNPYLVSLAHDLRRVWSLTLHVDVQVRTLNPLNYSRVLNARAFDLAFVQWGADYPDPENFLDTQLGTSPDNVTGWSRPDYQRSVVLADSYNPADPRRMTLQRAAVTIATRSVVVVPLDQPALTALIRPGLFGIALTGLNTVSIDPA